MCDYPVRCHVRLCLQPVFAVNAAVEISGISNEGSGTVPTVQPAHSAETSASGARADNFSPTVQLQPLDTFSPKHDPVRAWCGTR